MKSIIIIFTFLFSTLAYADGVLVYEGEGQFNNGYWTDMAGYSYSKKHGTASIYVRAEGTEFCTPTENGSCHTPFDVNNHQVEGLYFDRNVGRRGAIIFDSGEEQIICAYRRLVLGPKSTGLCEIKLSPRKRGVYKLQFFVEI